MSIMIKHKGNHNERKYIKAISERFESIVKNSTSSRDIFLRIFLLLAKQFKSNLLILRYQISRKLDAIIAIIC
jgi:hypothetical protein